MDNKEEIIKTALNLFAEEGYENTGVQKIVDVVGITKPTLYYYFKSKEGLLEEILKINFFDFFNELKVKAIYNGDIVSTLETVVFHYMNFAKQNCLFYRLIMNLSFAPENSIEYKYMINYLVEQHKIIENIFLNAEKDHGNMIGKNRRYAFSFIGIINSAISYYFFTKNEKDINEYAGRELCRQFMYGIFS